MMKNNITLPKIISICLLLVILFSCSTSKNNSTTNEVEMIKCLDDFITTYSTIKKDKELYALLILKVNENDESYYKVMDKPEKAILATLNEIKTNKSKYAVGKYKGVICQYSPNYFKTENLNFDKIEQSLFDKVRLVSDNITYKGKVLKITYGALEWEPTVEVDYDFKSKKKKIRILGKEEIVTQSFN